MLAPLLFIGFALGHNLGQEHPVVIDDTASQELLRLVKEDQADRAFFLKGTGKPTEEQGKKMKERDKGRFKRANEILATAPTLSVAGIDAAALIMQHGTDLESYVRAHELSACASFLGKPGSLVAAAEDRYLVNMKRKQRFGAQFQANGNESKPYPVDEAPPTAVTNSLRRIYFEPPLDIAKKLGFMGAFKFAMKNIQETIEHRMDPGWLKKNSDTKISDELAALPETAEARKRVLDLYNADKLVLDQDFLDAARVLASGSDSAELLLAHELVTVAFKEKLAEARPLFETTWDKFEVSIGHPARYANHKEPKAVQAVLESN